MCGIAGVYGWTDEDVLDEMLTCIEHRGPDDEGRLYSDNPPLMLGMRRLSIVDLEGGAQPIYNEDGSVGVVFNGEIYNHQSVRRDLESRGHRFSTAADTEVLVHLWEEYGVEMPKHIDGMFAFAIWDADEKTLFLARDRIGIKPLYFSTDADGFAFASELPALLATGIDTELDERAVYNYFSIHYSPWPQTLFSAVRKLEPGTSLLVNESGITQQRYWQLELDPVEGSAQSLASTVREMLESSVERRLMADVPVGAFLSGGLDSSTIVGILSEIREDPIQTFSVAFDGDTDESEEARFVADHFGTDHHEVTVNLDNVDLFEDLVSHYGEPLPDPAVLPTMVLSRYAAKEVKVVQTGSGADEIFAGYWMHRTIPRHRRLLGWFPRPVYKAANLLADKLEAFRPQLSYFASLSDDQTAVERAARRFKPLPPQEYLKTAMDSERSGLRSMVRDSFELAAPDNRLQRISAFYLRHWLPDDILYKVDHATMSASLEARVPYLDHRLVQFAYNIPPRHLTGSGSYKPLLKRAVGDLVPERTLNRSKQGFGISQGDWLRGRHDTIDRWFDSDSLQPVPFLDADKVHSLWSAHRREQVNHGVTLWKVLNYVAWYHKYCA